MAEAKKWNDVNHVVMGGRLTADAEIKAGETKDGRKYRLLKFSFATNNAGETMFPSVTLSVPESYKATALVKGAVVTVQGRITIKAGEKKTFIDIRPNGLDDIQVNLGHKAGEAPVEDSTPAEAEDIPF